MNDTLTTVFTLLTGMLPGNYALMLKKKHLYLRSLVHQNTHKKLDEAIIGIF